MNEMGTALYTYIEIFKNEFQVGEKRIRLNKIIIPIIQRDYAQGRIEPEINRIRARFLQSLHQAITRQPITLDFVYGDIDVNGIMTPLDGQQRLTALFLLHWYSAKKEGIPDSEYAFLKNFSYEIRYSSRDFCSFLVDFNPTFSMSLSEEIIDQAWFPLDWKKDPTISSMLVMLDAISEEFRDTKDIWMKLKGGAISFYFLPIKDLGLTDELYIKMNSRGKPLTKFEHFKAELERELKKIDESIAQRIIGKIDIDWTDMLWRYRNEDYIIDYEFLRYFRFICDVICYREGGSSQDKSNDEFDLLQEYFSSEKNNCVANIQTLENFFDCWCHFQGNETPSHFLERLFAHEHQEGKVKVENRYNINIFEDCLQNYADVLGNGNRQFPLNRFIMLYAVVIYLINRDSISEKDFSRRLRIVNNLVQNSEDEISDSDLRSSGNRMPVILLQVDSIILNGSINQALDKNLNNNQLAEEILKIEWVENNLEKQEMLYRLEDHDLLYGQVSIIGLDNPEYFKRFESLFSCNLDKVDCALLAIGNYAQRERNGRRYQLGSSGNMKAWRKLFHKSANSGFERTKHILNELLSKKELFTDDFLDEISNSYIIESENKQCFDWRYYYIKYPIFRPGSFGKYYWNDFENRPYEFSVMQTETNWSENTYQPFLKAVSAKRLSRDSYGQRIELGKKYLICENSSFVLKDTVTDTEEIKVSIAQNDQGFDVGNRIMKLKDFLHHDWGNLI